MTTIVASVAVLAGTAFMFVAALGVARFPDLYTRMQAATKATTVGVMGVMLAVGVASWDAGATIRAVLVAGFFLLTSPVAAHAIARSAHAREIPLAPGTRIELGDRAGARLQRAARDRAGPEDVPGPAPRGRTGEEVRR